MNAVYMLLFVVAAVAVVMAAHRHHPNNRQVAPIIATLLMVIAALLFVKLLTIRPIVINYVLFAGAYYLGYLGVTMLKGNISAIRQNVDGTGVAGAIKANLLDLLFFIALFSQFLELVSPSSSFLIAMGATWLVIEVLFKMIKVPERFRSNVAGAALIVVAAVGGVRAVMDFYY